MELLKNPYTAAAIVAICIVIFYLSNTGNFFGKFFNHFSPCTQNPAQSAPCYIGIDIAVMIVVALIGIAFAVVLIFDLYKIFKG